MNKQYSRSFYVDVLRAEIRKAGLLEPVSEWAFHPTRKWRFDLAWPVLKIGIEVDGAVYVHGRHTRGAGFEKDCEKINAAQILGWTVLRYSTGQVKQGMPLADLKVVLG